MHILIIRKTIKWEIVGEIIHIIKPQNIEISVTHFKV